MQNASPLNANYVLWGIEIKVRQRLKITRAPEVVE